MGEEKRRERNVPHGPKTQRGQRTDHPLRQFSRSLRDFRGGISDLKAVAERLGRTDRRKPEPIRSKHATRRSEPPRQRSRPSGTRSTNREKIPSFVGISPNLPQKTPSSSRARPYSGMKNVHTPEDREAVKHLTEEGYTGTLEDLPRAARVAMISRAGELLKEDGRRNRLVESLVGAIQSGKPEVAANFNPRKLEQTLGRLLGGKQNALRALWTPEVAKMASRYQFEREVERERLQAVERTLPEGSSARSGPSGELPVPASESVSGAAPASVPPSGRSNPQAVDNLFKRNDLLHLRGQSENRRQHLLSSATTERVQRSAAAGGTSQIQREISLPSEGAESKKASAATSMASEQDRSSGRRKLEGTLTMLNQNGDVLGEARLDGDDING